MQLVTVLIWVLYPFAGGWQDPKLHSRIPWSHNLLESVFGVGVEVGVLGTAVGVGEIARIRTSMSTHFQCVFPFLYLVRKLAKVTLPQANLHVQTTVQSTSLG